MTLYQNILVINLMHLGDLMLVTPVLRTLRHNYPKAHITLLADRILADIVQENRHIDECLLIDKKGKDRSFLGTLRFARRLRSKKYDLVVNLHRNERSSALAALSGGKKIIGYAKPGFSLLFDHVSPDQHPIMHEVHSHYAALRRGSSAMLSMRDLRGACRPPPKRRHSVSGRSISPLGIR